MQISETDRAKIDSVTSYATAHPIHKNSAVPTASAFRTVIDGKVCMFTVEDHPAGICRHLAVAIETPGEDSLIKRWTVHLDDVQFLAFAFGFRKALEDADQIYCANDTEDRIVIHILERLEIPALELGQ